jgi:hypothetical protein
MPLLANTLFRFVITSARLGGKWALLAMAVLGMMQPTWATEAPSTDAYLDLNCAVYFRQVAASHKQAGNDILAAPYLERMQLLLIRVKLDAIYQSTIASPPTANFNQDWQEALTRQTNLINRNYKNIRRLKLRYAKACEARLD